MMTTKEARSLIIEEVGKLSNKVLPVPSIGDYEVLFHTQCSSICTVDRRVYTGDRNKEMPFLGGHESSGIIEAVGKGVVELKVGDHAIFTSGYCNQCEMERSGKGTQCLHKNKMPQRAQFSGTIMGGGFSEYLAIPAWQVIKVNENIPLEHACLTEPLACCVHSINKANINFGDVVVIIGFGIMGYFQMKLAMLKGARVIVSETDDKRLHKAEQNGAITINPQKENLYDAVMDYTDKLGANVVVNTIPASTVWLEALNILAPYGKLIAYSSQNENKPIGVNFGTIHSKEIEIIGTLNPTIQDNDQALKLITYGMINMEEVIDSKFSIEDGKKAFDEALKAGAYRVVISFQEEK